MLLGVVCLCVLDCGLEDDDEATEEGSDFLPVFDDDFWSLEDFLADWSLELRDEDLGDLLVTVEDFTEFVKDLPEEGTVITTKKSLVLIIVVVVVVFSFTLHTTK